MGDDLKTEENIDNIDPWMSFLEKEHHEILSGLHKEIDRLQKTCSDLQFEVSSCNASAKIQNDLQKQVQHLEKDNAEKDILIQELKTNLCKSLERAQELELELGWKEVEHQNVVRSRDSKIVELRQNLTVTTDINRLQNEVKKLYEVNRNSARDRIEHVADLARRESIDELHSHQNTKKKKKKKASAKGDVEDDDVTKWRSIGSETSTSFGYQSISPDRKNSVESRSKVFRHKLQRIYSLDIRDWSVDSANVVDRSTNENHDQSLLLYSFESPPSTMPVIGYQRMTHSSLPFNSLTTSSAAAATRFPPIVASHGQERDSNQEVMNTKGRVSLSASMASMTSGFSVFQI